MNHLQCTKFQTHKRVNVTKMSRALEGTLIDQARYPMHNSLLVFDWVTYEFLVHLSTFSYS